MIDARTYIMLVFERKEAQPIVPKLSQYCKPRARDYLSNDDSFWYHLHLKFYHPNTYHEVSCIRGEVLNAYVWWKIMFTPPCLWQGLITSLLLR